MLKVQGTATSRLFNHHRCSDDFRGIEITSLCCCYCYLWANSTLFLVFLLLTLSMHLFASYDVSSARQINKASDYILSNVSKNIFYLMLSILVSQNNFSKTSQQKQISYGSSKKHLTDTRHWKNWFLLLWQKHPPEVFCKERCY